MALEHNSKLAENEPAWGDVDKTRLPRIAFADMGEPDKKSTWKYPHHFVKNGELGENGVYVSGDMYLHRGGLIAAWQAANGARSGQEASDAVKAHLLAHRRAIGLEDEKDLEILEKGFVFDYKIKDIETNDKENSIVHYITTEDVDWVDDVVVASGMDATEFEKYRTVFYNHDTYLPIGSNVWLKVVDGKGVLAKTRFATKNQFAQDIYNLFKEGIINTWSIRFRPKNTEDSVEFKFDNGKEITIYKQWDLIEYSAAPLAANPNTIVLAKSVVKSHEFKKEIEYFEKIFKLEEMILEQQSKIEKLATALNEIEKNISRIDIIEGDLKDIIKNIKFKINEPETLGTQQLYSKIIELAKSIRRS